MAAFGAKATFRHGTAARGAVVLYAPGRSHRCRHEHATHAYVARQIATLKGFEFLGDYDPAAAHPVPTYFVPSCTLLASEASALGIHSEDDLFGAVVPHAYMATKAVTHPLVGPGALAPPGWREEFGLRVSGSVLRGYSAFSAADARTAGERLLRHGPVRLKPVQATGGRGQETAFDASGLDAVIGRMEAEGIFAEGVVLEENLSEVATYSVGQVRVAGIVASYWGTQRLTPDNAGASVYGGSDLFLVQGGFDVLLALPLPDGARTAVEHARLYDEAARRHLPGLLASRRNYDVAAGFDAQGRWRCGVLEQSWRIGGASGAEVAALGAFRDSPGLSAVRASTVEVFGADVSVPPGAVVHFQGEDDVVGLICKYVTVDRHAGS